MELELSEYPNTSEYQMVFSGMPNWWDTVPMPIAKFFGHCDLESKVVIPFVINDGSGFGRIPERFREFYPGMKVHPSRAFPNYKVESSRNAIFSLTKGEVGRLLCRRSDICGNSWQYIHGHPSGPVLEETAGTRALLGGKRKEMVALAIPIGVTLFFQQLNNIADSLWVAGLGRSAIAAMGIVYPIYTILIDIDNGLEMVLVRPSPGASAAVSMTILTALPPRA